MLGFLWQGSPVRHVLVTLVHQNTCENNLKGVVSVVSVSGAWWLEHMEEELLRL